MPIVSEEVANAIEAELMQGKTNYISEILDRIKEDNPVIYDVLYVSLDSLK